MATPSSKSKRRGWPLVVAATAVIAVVLAIAGYLVIQARSGDVSHGTKVLFKSKPAAKPKGEIFKWPFYGYDAAHTRYLPSKLRPPYRVRWRISGQILTEFSPVLADGVLYLAKNNATVFAVRARSGFIIWKRKIARLNASSPAYANGRIFVATLSRRVVCLDARTGRVRWSWRAASRVESSPVVSGGTVYFGSESGTLYAVSATDGHIKWTYRAPGALKAAPALANGVLYIGDYAGRMHAVRANNGKEVWSTGTSGAKLGFSSGEFYSTPAVDFGRVYAGNTDGKIYSFSARTGELAWSQSTGGYVYAGPAVAQVPGTRPTVYIGSYDGLFYALDARTGSVRWSHNGGGRISGAGTVIGSVVYYSNLAARKTIGLDVHDGRVVFVFDSGSFNPVISDGKMIYLTGYSSLWGLEPRKSARLKKTT